MALLCARSTPGNNTDPQSPLTPWPGLLEPLGDQDISLLAVRYEGASMALVPRIASVGAKFCVVIDAAVLRGVGTQSARNRSHARTNAVAAYVTAMQAESMYDQEKAPTALWPHISVRAARPAKTAAAHLVHVRRTLANAGGRGRGTGARQRHRRWRSWALWQAYCERCTITYRACAARAA